MSKAVTTAVGARIRTLREGSGASQEAFARSVGMDRAYLGRVERGGQNISVVTAARIAGALGVGVAALFEGVPAVDASGNPVE
jgi:transcriptional regulator with XRE-family HTH domain